jgi:hypothetical protein
LAAGRVKAKGRGSGFKGSGFWVLGSKVQGSKVLGSGFKVQGSRFRLRVQGSRFRGSGFKAIRFGFRSNLNYCFMGTEGDRIKIEQYKVIESIRLKTVSPGHDTTNEQR